MVMQSPHALSLLACRMEETQSTLDYHVCEAKRLANLLAELRADFNEATNFSAPIASFPNEVLAMIFQAGCILPRRNVDEALEPPFELLVSSISRRWRNIAISTPKLWTKIDVLPQKPLDLALTYLMRSGTLPLDIQVDLRFNRRGSLRVNPFLEVFMPQIGRWRSMCIQSKYYHFLRTILRHIRSATAPLLESLHIFVENDIDEEDVGSDSEVEEEQVYSDTGEGDDEASDRDARYDSKIGNIFTGGTPSLRLLRLTGIGLHICVPSGSTLTTLHVHGAKLSPLSTTFSHFRDTLDSLSALVHLFVYGCIVSYDWGGIPTRAATLPMLSSLHLLPNRGFSPPLRLLAIISAPMLECLTIQHVRVEAFDHEPAFQRPEWVTALPRYPRLRSLLITPILMAATYPHDFSVLHRIFSTITKLTMPTITVPQFLRIFPNEKELNTNAIVSSGVPLWPCLQVLTLGILSTDDADPLHKFLSDRIAQGYPVRKLRLRFSGALGGTKSPSVWDICERMGVELEEAELEEVNIQNDAGYYCDDC